MVLPLILIFFATAAAAVLAYGTDPTWAQFAHGFDFILWSRRLQWPLIVTTLILCLALLAVVIAGKRRAWWLVALLPILALFVHRFVSGPARMVEVVEEPTFAEADQASFIQDDDYVVGVRFGDVAYAFPYSVLYNAPAVVLSDRERRMVLLWSAFANRATAYSVSREVRARDLEIVSSPANALLIYNTRLGQFINGLTGQTNRGEKPAGFRDVLAVVKTTWGHWHAMSPESRVMMPLDMKWRTAPRQPLRPRYPMPRARPDLLEERLVSVIAATQPIAVPSDAVTKSAALNLSAGKTTVLLFRQASSGTLRAFDRHIEDDLAPRFTLATDPKRPEVALSDADTNTRWSSAGIAVEGPPETHGKRLTALPVEEDLYWGVMRYWYADLRLIEGAALTAAAAPGEQPVATLATAPAAQRGRPVSPNRRKRAPGPATPVLPQAPAR